MNKKTKQLRSIMRLHGGELDGLQLRVSDHTLTWPCGISFLMPEPEPLQLQLDLAIGDTEPIKLHEVQYWISDCYEEDNGHAYADYFLDEGDEA